MTSLEAMLERAAEAQPVTFDANDVRRRVRGRRRARRSLSGIVVVLVVVGVFGLAHANGTRRDGLADSVDTASLVGRWTPVTVDGVDMHEYQLRALDQIDAEIQRQQDTIDQLGGLDHGPARQAAQELLVTLYEHRADVQTRTTELDLRGDGTFDGRDVLCGELVGRWRLDGDRLVVDMTKGGGCVQGGDPVSLSQVLRSNPTVSHGADPGTLGLTSRTGSATFQR